MSDKAKHKNECSGECKEAIDYSDTDTEEDTDGCRDSELYDIDSEIEMARRILDFCEKGSRNIGDGFSDIGAGLGMLGTSFERGMSTIARAMVEVAKVKARR